MKPRRTGKTLTLTLVLLLGAALALLVSGAGPAAAHAALGGSDPADNAVLETAPKQVTLTFTESVTLSDDSVRVLAPDNRRVNRGRAEHVAGERDTARVKLRADLPDGTYTVAWRAVSADSHPVSGAFVFSVGEPSAAATAPSEPPRNTATAVLHGISEYGAYSGLALLLGGCVLVLACWPPGTPLGPLRGLTVIGWAVLLLSTLAVLLLHGPYEAGDSPAGAFDPELLRRTLDTGSGIALTARLLLVALSGAFLARVAARFSRHPDEHPHGGTLAVGTLLALGLAVTWAVAEHASAGVQVPVAIVSTVAHLLAMSVWLGGLAALLIALHRAPADRAVPWEAVARFSTFAFTSVVVLAATGIYQSWRQLGSWDALVSTTYGKLLAVKVLAVLLLLIAASYSRDRTAQLSQAHRTRTPDRVPQPVGTARPGAYPALSGPGTDAGAGAAPDPGSPWLRLRRSVGTEVAIGVAVLAVTSVLTGTQPGRSAVTESAAAAAAQAPKASSTTIPFDVGTPDGKGTVNVVLAPGRVGENTVQALVFASDGGIATVPGLRLTFTLKSQGIGPLDANLEDRKGYWGTESLLLPVPGTWTMKVTVRTSEIDQVTESGTVRIAP